MLTLNALKIKAIISKEINRMAALAYLRKMEKEDVGHPQANLQGKDRNIKKIENNFCFHTMSTHPNESKRVLAIEVHPDDAEFLMAGTLTLLHQKGYKVYIASVCTGDKGSKTLSPQEITSKRFEEATQSAQILNGSFETLGVPDGELVFENEIRAKVIELVRRVDPDIIITTSPNDYMPDHEIASYLTFDACFFAFVPNYDTKQPNPAKALNRIPNLYYADPVELTDKFGQKVLPEFYVDIAL